MLANLYVLYAVYTVVHRRTLARSPILPTFQVTVGFALPATTALSSLRFTDPLLAAEHFRLLVLGCGTAMPLEVTSTSSLTTFRTRLQTFLFTDSYPDIRLI